MRASLEISLCPGGFGEPVFAGEPAPASGLEPYKHAAQRLRTTHNTSTQTWDEHRHRADIHGFIAARGLERTMNAVGSPRQVSWPPPFRLGPLLAAQNQSSKHV